MDSTSAWSRWSSCSLQLGEARARPRGASADLVGVGARARARVRARVRVRVRRARPRGTSADIEEGAKYERRDQRLLPERSRQSSDGDSASSPASALTPRPAILLKPRSSRNTAGWRHRASARCAAPSSPSSFASRLTYVRKLSRCTIAARAAAPAAPSPASRRLSDAIGVSFSAASSRSLSSGAQADMPPLSSAAL